MGKKIDYSAIESAVLKDSDLAYLKSLGVRSLPTSPTANKWDAESIKKQFYKQPEILFAWLRRLSDASLDMAKNLDRYLFQEAILSKGGLFSPSVSPVAPNPDSNHVWVDTKSMSVDAQEQPDASPSENAEALTFGESDDSLTFGEDGDGSVSFQEDGGKDAAEEVTFGESNDDITFGDK